MGMTVTGKREITGCVGNIGSYKTAFLALALDASATAFAKAQDAPISEVTTNGLGRAAATVTQATTTDANDTLQFYKSWTCTGGTNTVNAVCVMNNATAAGTMGSRDVLTSTRTLTSGSTITETVKWVFA